jgi:hypothetical protein
VPETGPRFPGDVGEDAAIVEKDDGRLRTRRAAERAEGRRSRFPVGAGRKRGPEAPLPLFIVVFAQPDEAIGFGKGQRRQQDVAHQHERGERRRQSQRQGAGGQQRPAGPRSQVTPGGTGVGYPQAQSIGHGSPRSR